MNSFKKALLATTAIAASFTTSVKADEFRIDRLFVVGDSLSDAGTYSQAVQAGAALGGQQVPNIRYRFTTNNPDGSSQNYAEVLADELGIGPLEPNIINGVPAAAGTPIAGLANDVNVGGTSYAQGGSRVALPALDAATQTPRGITQLPVTQQVDRMLAANPNLGPNDLVVLWAGSNDVLANAELIGHGTITPAQAGQNIVTAASEMIGQVQRVIDAGATNIVVVTVPDIGTSTPLGAGSTPAGQAGLSSLASAYNNALVAGVGGRVTVVNSDAILGDVLANPTRYGFSNANQLATIACPGSALNCITGVNTVANGTIFADPVHPTEQTHRILGQMSAATLVAVGQVGVMPVATITALRQQAIGLENRLSLGSFFMNGENGERIRRPVGNVEIYGGGEVGFYESDAQQVVPGFDAQTQVTKLAADVMVTPNVMIGAGVGLDHGQVEFDNDRGGFDTRLYLGALFGVAQIVPGVYASGVIGGGLIDIYEIERNFDMRNRNGSLIARDSFEADTEGTYVLAKATVGGVLPVGNGFFVNPSVGFTFERVDIDGYSESAIGASTPSLAGTYDDLEYEGHRVTAALGGFYRPPSAPSWVFGLRGSWEHDFNDDNIVVRHANAGMPLAASSSPRPDDSYGFLSGVISKELTHSTALTLQGSTVVGQDGVSGYTVGLLLKHTF